MVTRRERVVLELEDRFSRGIAEAAVQTKTFERTLRDLDGTSSRSQRSLGDVDSSVQKVGRSSQTTDRSINQLTGRLRLLTDVALTLGPALVPIGGAGVTAVAGLAAQFGALAGGIGIAVASLNGIGDALGAVNDYQLEPTADNLAKVAEEFERIGSAGAEFVVFLESVSPQLREMQMLAREGFLPGLAEGIESFLSRGSQLNNIVSDLAQAMGELSASAGGALGGENFDAFFGYLDNEAGPLLLEFGRSVGYVAEGLANMLVAFAPASSDFSSGLEDMTRSFAEWSRGLQDNDSFQEFLAYIRQNGPAAVDFIGELIQALSSVVEAAAPIGQAVLPVLTTLLDLFGKVASTPIGTTLLTVAAGFVAFNRAASIAGPAASRLGDALFLTDRAFQQTGSSATAAGTKISTALKFGGVIAGIMLVSDAVNSLGTQLETASLARNLEAFARGAEVANFEDMGQHIQVMASSMRAAEEPLLELTSGFGLLGDTARDKASKEIGIIDQALASMVESGNAEQAAILLERFVEAAVARGVDADEARRQFDDYAVAVENTGAAAEETSESVKDMGPAFESASAATDKLRERLQGAREALKESRQGAREVAQSFVGLGESLNDSETSLGGWLKELERNAEALRAFQDNARQAGRRGLDEGLVESLRNAGSEGALRMRQLANATDEEIARANKAWRNGQGAVKDFVNEVGGVKPKYVTRLEAQVEQALSELRRLKEQLNIPDEFVNVWVTRRVSNVGGMGPQEEFPIRRATGGRVIGPGTSTSDSIPAWLSTGEHVWSAREVANAGGHAAVEAIRSQFRFASGGTPGRIDRMNPLYGIGRDFISAGDMAGRLVNLTVRQLAQVGEDMERLAKGPLSKLSKAFEKATDLAQEELEASKDKLRALKDERDSIAATVESRLKTADLFGQVARPGGFDFASNTEGLTPEQIAANVAAQNSVNAALGFNVASSPVDILRADLARAREEQRMIEQLKLRGLSGSALQYAIESDGGLTGALDLSRRELRQFENLYDRRDRVSANVGDAAGNAVLGQEIRQQTREVRAQREVTQAIRQEARDTNRRLERLEKLAEKAPKETGSEVGKAVNGAAAGGQRRRQG